MKVLDYIMPITFGIILAVSILVLGIDDTVKVFIKNLFILVFIIPIYIFIYFFSKFIKINTKIKLTDIYKKLFKKELKLTSKNSFWNIIFLTSFILFFGLEDTVGMFWTYWFILLAIIQVMKASYSYQLYMESSNKNEETQ